MPAARRTATRARPRRPAGPILPPELRPARAVVRRSAGTWTLQTTLDRHGLGPVAGVDEAGRGACAGPLVVASCVLRAGDAKHLVGLTDSKQLSAAAREEYYEVIVRRAADHAVIVIPPEEVDRRGVHVANIEGMRRAVAGLATRPGYVLTDGFPVRGFGAPALAVPKGDQAAACVAAASVLAKVTRDRIMVGLDAEFPQYRFAEHKGYCTPVHDAALAAHGPSRVHRFSFVNVRAARAACAPPDSLLDSPLDTPFGVAEPPVDPADVGPTGPRVHNGAPIDGSSEVGSGGGMQL
ncbi:ribonuclease HII [Pseudonocardia lacus]|uniref:ribonuclease HII n=1 Tax=Pseudonocardia lacus TaxID=2835865 RepID=UPI001BDCD0D8|nr:ribonuclease HII [Pseudonocardia lacus]